VYPSALRSVRDTILPSASGALTIQTQPTVLRHRSSTHAPRGT
jgi:hypothetical protein